MVLEKGRRAKVLGYTFVIFGAICLARVPTTNSKYYTSSDINNNDYLKYSTNFRQLTYGQTTFGTEPTISDGNATIRLVVTRNTGNGIPTGNNSTEDIYIFRPNENCKITQLGDNEITDSDFGQEKEIGYTGNLRQDINVSLMCKTESVESGDDQGILGVPVKIGQELVTDASLDVYEKVGINGKYEDEFLYRSYQEKFSNPIGVTAADSITINLTEEKQFEKFIEWIVKYAHSSTGNTELIKTYIENKIDRNLIGQYTDATKIPEIQGISKEVSQDGNSVTFSVKPNLIGYIKTYNYYEDNVKNNPDNDRFRLYFSIPVEDANKDEINSILTEYLKQYIISEDDADYREFIKYFEGKAYNILLKNGAVNGLYAGYNHNEIDLISLKGIRETIQNYYKNSFVLKSSSNNDDFLPEFAKTLQNAIHDELISNDAVLNSYIHDKKNDSGQDYKLDHSVVEYANKNYLSDIDYSTDRYIIYNSDIDSSKYLLIKIANEDNDSMRIFFADFETAIEEYKSGVGIFNPDDNKFEISIDMLLPQSLSASVLTEYRNRAKIAIDKLNEVLNNNCTEEQAKHTRAYNVRTNGYNYIEYQYIMTSNAVVEDANQDENNLEDQIAMQSLDNENIQSVANNKIVNPELNSNDSEKNINTTDDNQNIKDNNMNIQVKSSDTKTNEYSNDTQQDIANSIKDANTNETNPDTNID